MDEALRSAGWICIVAVVGAYATFLVAGSVMHAKDSGTANPVIIRDHISKGEHHISGMIVVPQTCDLLTLVVKKMDESTYQLAFATWSEPSVTCLKQESPRVFNTVVFAPSIGVRFTATLDGKLLDTAVYPTLAK